MSSAEKALYKGADDYIVKNGGPVIAPLNKNYILLTDEIEERLNQSNICETLNIDSFSREKSIQDFLSSLENEEYVKEIYKRKKQNVKNGINTSDATILMECFRQGRTLLQAGMQADVLAKPLIDFYAASAYAYAIIVINSPLHKSIKTLKGSHGHTYDHANGTVDFGGDIPSGTFMDLLCAFPVAQVSYSNSIFKYSVVPSIDLIQNSNVKIALSTLLSMVPEINGCYLRYDSKHKNIHKITYDTTINNSVITYNFYIGDGRVKPNIDKLKECFCTEDISENQGSYKISMNSQNINKIFPIIYRDIRGDLWYVETPIDKLYLPEICLHFLIISALCNIMRYSPHEWSDILTNRISSQYSFLINQYLRLFELKFPLLVTECLTNYVPILEY